MTEDYSWEFIDSYFKDNKQCLVKHHIESYNAFFETGIQNIFREKNPIKIMKTMVIKYFTENRLYMMKHEHILCIQMKHAPET